MILGIILPSLSHATLPPHIIDPILEQCHQKDKAYKLTTLTGGYSGAGLYKLDTSDSTLVIRHLSDQTPEEEFKRLAELTTLAGQSGASPRALFIDLDKKIVVTEFIHGQPYKPIDLQQGDLEELAYTLKKFHRANLTSYVSDPIERFESYLKQISAERRPSSFQNILNFIDEFRLIREKFQIKGFVHTDLHAMNILHEDNHFWIIDLEDSGIGDIYFDIGQLIKNFSLDENQATTFLHAYFGMTTQFQRDYIFLNTQLAHAVYAAWGLCHGLDAIQSQVHLDKWLEPLLYQSPHEFLKDVHDGTVALETPKDKLHYGLINLAVFLQSWQKGQTFQTLQTLKNLVP